MLHRQGPGTFVRRVINTVGDRVYTKPPESENTSFSLRFWLSATRTPDTASRTRSVACHVPFARASASWLSARSCHQLTFYLVVLSHIFMIVVFLTIYFNRMKGFTQRNKLSQLLQRLGSQTPCLRFFSFTSLVQCLFQTCLFGTAWPGLLLLVAFSTAIAD